MTLSPEIVPRGMAEAMLRQMIDTLRGRDDKLCQDAADQIEDLKDETELWKDRYYSERRDHEASIKEFTLAWIEARGESG